MAAEKAPGTTPSSETDPWKKESKGSLLGRAKKAREAGGQAVAKVREVTTRSDEPAETTLRRPVQSSRPPRQARLRLTHIDPWSVTKAAFVLSIVLGVVAVVAVFIVWTVLGAAGLWDAINSAMSTTLGDSGGQPFQVQDYVGTARAVGFTMIVSVVDVVLLTMIATLAAFLYNLAAALLGGIELTLSEED